MVDVFVLRTRKYGNSVKNEIGKLQFDFRQQDIDGSFKRPGRIFQSEKHGHTTEQHVIERKGGFMSIILGNIYWPILAISIQCLIYHRVARGFGTFIYSWSCVQVPDPHSAAFQVCDVKAKIYIPFWKKDHGVISFRMGGLEIVHGQHLIYILLCAVSPLKFCMVPGGVIYSVSHCFLFNLVLHHLNWAKMSISGAFQLCKPVNKLSAQYVQCLCGRVRTSWQSLFHLSYLPSIAVIYLFVKTFWQLNANNIDGWVGIKLVSLLQDQALIFQHMQFLMFCMYDDCWVPLTRKPVLWISEN